MKTKDKSKIRFNLSRGDHYMKWQIRDPHGNVEYYEPSEVTLVMEECVLRNNKRGAKEIFSGGDKTVVAWVECAKVEVFRRVAIKSMKDTKVEYNPKKQPYWYINGEDSDKVELSMIHSVGRELFTSN